MASKLAEISEQAKNERRTSIEKEIDTNSSFEKFQKQAGLGHKQSDVLFGFGDECSYMRDYLVRNGGKSSPFTQNVTLKRSDGVSLNYSNVLSHSCQIIAKW